MSERKARQLRAMQQQLDNLIIDTARQRVIADMDSIKVTVLLERVDDLTKKYRELRTVCYYQPSAIKSKPNIWRRIMELIFGSPAKDPDCSIDEPDQDLKSFRVGGTD
jgi:hypothetical protein